MDDSHLDRFLVTFFMPLEKRTIELAATNYHEALSAGLEILERGLNRDILKIVLKEVSK